jgi:hypothetical protein
MGTRGAIGVRTDNNLFVTYNHGDSYPESLGRDMVKFCRSLSKQQLAMLAEQFKHIKIVDFSRKPTSEEQKTYTKNGYCDLSVSEQSPLDWYCLLRNLQGVAYLRAILNGDCQHWIDEMDFLKDSLFCEYAYILNLDDGTLEFYKGFNQGPDRNSPLPFKHIADKDGYYPVRYQGKVDITKIPYDWITQFYPPKTE